MTWTLFAPLQLDPADVALNDWRASLYDRTGNLVSGPLSTGFGTVSPAIRFWSGEVASGFRGVLRVVSESVAEAEYVAEITDADELDSPLHAGLCRGWAGNLVAVGTIQLATTASVAAGAYLTHVLEVLSGNLEGQRFSIIGYNSATQTATLSRPWPVLPDSPTFACRVLRQTSPSISGTGNVSLIAAQRDVAVTAVIESVATDRRLVTLSAAASNSAGAYVDQIFRLVAGNLGFSAQITAYDHTTRTVTLADPLPAGVVVGTDQASIAFAKVLGAPTAQQVADEVADVLAVAHGAGNWESEPAVAAADAARAAIEALVNAGVSLTALERQAVVGAVWGNIERTLTGAANITDPIRDAVWTRTNRTITGGTITSVPSVDLTNGAQTGLVAAVRADLERSGGPLAQAAAGGSDTDEIVARVLAGLQGTSVRITAPQLEDGKPIRIVRGDDYAAADQRALRIEIESPLPLNMATVRLSLASGSVTLTRTGSVTGTSPNWTAQFPLTQADTLSLPPTETGRWEVSIELAVTRDITLRQGPLKVIRTVRD